MRGKGTDIKSLIQRIADKPMDESYLLPCKVVSVDEEARTCNVQPYNGAANIYKVRLQAISGGTKGVCLIPAIEASVIVDFLDNNNACVVLTEEVS